MTERRRIFVRLGGKFNMGDYNILDIAFEAEDYVRDDLDEGKLDKGLERLYSLLDNKLHKKVQESSGK